jgi:ribosomal protein L12E/L44/L45/RPP1/RPP2
MAMKYLAAYLMAVVSEDSHPSQAKVEAILNSIGATIEKDVLAAFFQKIEGKNAHELIASGLGKLSSFAAAAPAASAAAASPSKKAAASPKAAAKKEEVCFIIVFIFYVPFRMKTPVIWVSAFSIKQVITLSKRLVTISKINERNKAAFSTVILKPTKIFEFRTESSVTEAFYFRYHLPELEDPYLGLMNTLKLSVILVM